MVDFHRRLSVGPEQADRILRHVRDVKDKRPSWNLDQYVWREDRRVSPLQFNSGYSLVTGILDVPERAVAWARESLYYIEEGQTSRTRRQIEEFCGPVLTVLGTHDGLMDYALVRERCSAFRQGTIVTIHGGSHFLLVEHASAVTKLIDEFLRNGSISASCPAQILNTRMMAERPFRGIHGINEPDARKIGANEMGVN